jgi:hypothetical protein
MTLSTLIGLRIFCGQGFCEKVPIFFTWINPIRRNTVTVSTWHMHKKAYVRLRINAKEALTGYRVAV